MIDFDGTVLAACEDAFSTAGIVYQPANGLAFPARGVFDEPFLELQPTGEGGTYAPGRPAHISARRAVLGVRLSELAVAPAQGDYLTMPDGRRFWVREVRPDSHGGASLLLNLATGQMP